MVAYDSIEDDSLEGSTRLPHNLKKRLDWAVNIRVIGLR